MSQPSESGPVIPKALPEFGWVRVQMSIVAKQKTIYPGPPETHKDYVWGFPFELHPFAWDYLWIRCDGYRVEIKPHYFWSTHDTFWTDASGKVTAWGMWFLFPHTLGKQSNLLKGVVATLGFLPDQIRVQHPHMAVKIEEIYQKLKTLEDSPPPPDIPDLSWIRRKASEAFWRLK